ncbi:hypothetical protein [uncultured Fretibacterium sp.]|uniref:hypothetical protein n=1 Tax=uncultured Fretibacterium sp. TaxID=1678694 RepID=UPI0026180F0B|nr:hypothetical protein [uncultured Fretibacterium sp.]
MALEEIRSYFVRHVLGRLRVRCGTPAMESPAVGTLRRWAEVHPMRTRMQVRAPALLSFRGGLECSSRGFRFSRDLVRVRGERVRRRVPTAAAARMSLVRSVRSKDGLRRVLALPQERGNRLTARTPRPNLPGVAVLAWYGPLIEGAVVKLALNRQRGTLFIWYNPRSRHFKPAGLFLARRLGAGAKPEWLWV